MTNQHDRLRHDVLQRLLEVSQHLSASAKVTEILSVIINAMRDTLDAERATVFEYDAVKQELFSTVAHGLGKASKESVGPDEEQTQLLHSREIRIPVVRGLAGQCAQTRRLINISDAYADDRFDLEIDKQTGFRTRSILTVPLLAYDGELIGVIQVLNKRARSFDVEDEQIALALASHAAVAIKRGRLIEDQLMRKKLERDLQLAQRIQQNTFPAQLPTLRGFSIDAWCEPAEETGGDAYDVIGISPSLTGSSRLSSVDETDRAVLLLADATGHGIGPALSVTQVHAVLRTLVRMDIALPMIAHHMNLQLCDDLPSGHFITVWLGELNANERTLTSFSAGQAPLIRYEALHNEFDVLPADTVPLGVIDDLGIGSSNSFAMKHGDIFAAISDGIFEAPDSNGRMFGTERLIEIISKHRDTPPSQILTAIRDAVANFTNGAPATDDRTAIIIKCTAP